jgi:hypothetical protein
VHIASPISFQLHLGLDQSFKSQRHKGAAFFLFRSAVLRNLSDGGLRGVAASGMFNNYQVSEHGDTLRLPFGTCLRTGTFLIYSVVAEEGVRRYGFHGLSYEYIASQLPRLEPELAEGRVIVAHLGSGATQCALQAGRSVATTMSFTALDGLVMATRCGNLDPAVALYLMERHSLDARALERLLYEESGLLGVSGISSDMRTLLERPHNDNRRQERCPSESQLDTASRWAIGRPKTVWRWGKSERS